MIGISVSPRRRLRNGTASGPPDVTAPTLTILAFEETTGDFSFVSDEVGALHWLVDTTTGYGDADALVAAKLAGQSSGSALAMIGPNVGDVDLTVLPEGNWHFHVGVVDAAGNASNVLSSSFTLASEGLQFGGDQLEWNGDQLIFNAA